MKNATFHSIPGMADIVPPHSGVWQHVEQCWQRIASQYGYQEIRMPLLEFTELFKRSLGETADVVGKEMFSFLDRDEKSLTLRPEGTASCVRACLEGGLFYHQTPRLWYIGPMFRYERPQKGRSRQFHQIGVETFGLSGPEIEMEHILMIWRFWKQLGIESAVTLEINSLGSAENRLRYRAALVAYLTPHYDRLDEESQKRLIQNPLRILDSKNPVLAEIIAEAPRLSEFWDADSQQNFDILCTLLRNYQIPFTVNPRLVRGLDYYNHTVYEWITPHLGTQNAVCAGGRYDGLVEQLGGEPVSGVGFALGLERVLLLMEAQGKITCTSGIDVYIVGLGIGFLNQALKLSEMLRDTDSKIRVMIHGRGGNFKSQFKYADSSGALFAFIMGEEELKRETVSIKHLREASPQQTLSWFEAIAYVCQQLQVHQEGAC
jgi:histidyl-tRNA synthetase